MKNSVATLYTKYTVHGPFPEKVTFEHYDYFREVDLV